MIRGGLGLPLGRALETAGRWRAPWRRGCAWARWGRVPGGPTALV